MLSVRLFEYDEDEVDIDGVVDEDEVVAEDGLESGEVGEDKFIPMSGSESSAVARSKISVMVEPLVGTWEVDALL